MEQATTLLGFLQSPAVFGDLAGQTAIVTGGSRGIGQGIADFLGRQGMNLVLTARSEGEGTAFVQKLRDRGDKAIWATGDVSEEADAKRVFDTALEHFGRVDLLVNNAANLRSKAFQDLDWAAYSDSFEKNVRIFYHLSFLAARHMASRKSGNIVNISSVGALRGHRGHAGYDASNGAIDAFTRSMSLDLAPEGVRVNVVAPGATLNRPTDDSNRERHSQKVEGIPLERMGNGEDIGAAVGFLASSSSSYITGQILYVDGGLTTQLTPPGIFI